jgi:hypothetical protein
MKTTLLLYVLLFVFVGLSACKKDNYKMDMDVGKYEIIQYRSYPNGTKDTLKWNGYGPKGKPQNIYVFYKNSGDDSNSMWTIDFVNKKLSNWDNNSEALFYKIISETHTSERMEVTYDYLFDGYVSDSASGKIMFNRVPL